MPEGPALVVPGHRLARRDAGNVPCYGAVPGERLRWYVALEWLFRGVLEQGTAVANGGVGPARPDT